METKTEEAKGAFGRAFEEAFEEAFEGAYQAAGRPAGTEDSLQNLSLNLLQLSAEQEPAVRFLPA
jgi:hypothetical protein